MSVNGSAENSCRDGCRDSWMTGACCVALAGLVPIALYQLGVLNHLPDPPGKVFASDQITSSKAAHPFGIPDSLLGLASYGTTLGLLVASRKSSLCGYLLGAKLCMDGAAAGFNSVRQVVSFKRICSWCMVTAGATAVMVFAGRGCVRADAVAAFDMAKRLS